ncbi:Iterative polyketide synthase CazM 7 [Colletotrichum chlorophyti]|uniref:Iterative polyketide synthase CazM 7 n=1 Tax=Colletotrichum chlorophyti TaxID=708187 RepID=A0A1Q8S1Z5_9PEZI|nr:Iterative polyketide synthase CazM 7 [Colletotrichum chlorophyti]
MVHQNGNSVAESDFGCRLIPHVIDDVALKHPDKECFQIPRSNNPEDGWRIITFQDYAKAIDRAAHKIVDEYGRASSDDIPTIAYIGPNDARYVVLLVAAIKAGYKALFLSPRNSYEGQINLLEKTDCRALAYDSSYRTTVEPWILHRQMEALEVDHIDKWFRDGDVPHFSYRKTFESGRWEPLVALHTSGSTGLPKPVVSCQGMFAIADGQRKHPEWHGTLPLFPAWAKTVKRTFLPMPLFHGAALCCFFILTVYYGVPSVLGNGSRPLSADFLAECLRNVEVSGAVLPPSILEDISRSSEHMKAISRLDLVAFGGGNLSPEPGHKLVQNGVKLVNFIGATEVMPFPNYLNPNPKLWQYFIMNSKDYGCEWRKSTVDDGTYELFFVRMGKEPGLQAVFYTFPDLNEYGTRDLYKPHPELPDHWIYHGRADNIIVFSNGEKLNPITIEELVSQHPKLRSVLVVGSQRFQAGLILEPTVFPKDEKETQLLIDDVWHLVEQANDQTVAHGRIDKNFIIVSSPQKPFPRTDKGTIKRAAALKLHDTEVGLLYETASHAMISLQTKLDVSSVEGLTLSIQRMFETELGSRQIDKDTDFFAAGVDSLQINRAVGLIRGSLQDAGLMLDETLITARAIYNNQTPSKLARYIIQPTSDGKGRQADEEADCLRMMETLRSKYSQDFHLPKRGRPNALNDNQTIILTGSTGMLGSFILHDLVMNASVSRIICFNRAADGGLEQQDRTMKERGLTSNYIEKTQFYCTDISRADLGLPESVYTQLLGETDRIIHNAWSVNFNMPFESFEPQLRGTRNLADFATKADKRVALVFVSSVSTVHNWDSKKGPVPEVSFTDLRLPKGGYGCSKAVASLILEDAAKAGDFDAAIIRVAQIAGSEAGKGVWNRHEWLPSIIASSLHLKALPYELGNMNLVDWTPVERVSKLVQEVAGVSQPVDQAEISGYFHGANPSVTTFDGLAEAIQDFYGKERIPHLVSFADWVELLEKASSERDVSLDQNPAIKLLDTYIGMSAAQAAGRGPVQLEMKRTAERSPTMKNSKMITPELMKEWLAQWDF